jgi:hypothetical protein
VQQQQQQMQHPCIAQGFQMRAIIDVSSYPKSCQLLQQNPVRKAMESPFQICMCFVCQLLSFYSPSFSFPFTTLPDCSVWLLQAGSCTRCKRRAQDGCCWYNTLARFRNFKLSVLSIWDTAHQCWNNEFAVHDQFVLFTLIQMQGRCHVTFLVMYLFHYLVFCQSLLFINPLTWLFQMHDNPTARLPPSRQTNPLVIVASAARQAGRQAGKQAGRQAFFYY